MTQEEKSVFDRLGKEMRRDIVVGGFIACFIAISTLFTWGVYNQHKVNSCNERFTNFALELEKRAEYRALQKEKEIDSLKIAVKTELNNLKRDKAEVELKLKNLKRK